MEDIIRLFSANETNFNHNETIITDVLSLETQEEENGIFYCEMTCPIDDRIEEGKILKVPTPRGEQLFRIIKVKKTLPAMTLYVYGRHISYDLLNNMILNIRPTDATQQNALNTILSGTEYAHPFTATSDVPGLNTANYVRMNPIQAIMGADNSALNLWGGFLRRDNFVINVKATSPDKGYEVRFGKNLLGVDEELDMTDVVTRLYPTVVIQEPTVTVLPEKYVDSPLINNYPNPIMKEYRIALTEEEKALPIESIYALMRTACAEQFAFKADQPKVNYKVDFVELRKTEQFKHLAVLEELDISDTVWVYVSPLNLSMSSRMIKYRHDGLNDRYLSMELGNFKPKLTNQKSEFVKLVKDATKDLTDGVITSMLKDAVDTIQGNMGGNMVTILNDGKPVALAFMDTDDVATCDKYIILNSAGIAFGENGLNNPPELAINIDGTIAGQSAFFASLTTNLISSDIGQNLDLSSNEGINLIVSEINTEIANIEASKNTNYLDGQSVKTILTPLSYATDHAMVIRVPAMFSGQTGSFGVEVTDKIGITGIMQIGVFDYTTAAYLINDRTAVFEGTRCVWENIQFPNFGTDDVAIVLYAGIRTQTQNKGFTYQYGTLNLGPTLYSYFPSANDILSLNATVNDGDTSLVSRVQSVEQRQTAEYVETVVSQSSAINSLMDQKVTTGTQTIENSIRTDIDGTVLELTTAIEANGVAISTVTESVRISGANIDIGRSDSPTSLHIDSDSVDIVRNGAELATFSGSRTYAPKIEAEEMRFGNILVMKGKTGYNAETTRFVFIGV